MANENQSGVADLVTSKLNDDRPGKAADTRKKFIVYMTETTRIQLDSLAKVTATGKIELASEIFAIGIRDAANQCVVAGRMTKDFRVKEAKAEEGNKPSPAAPAASTPNS